MANNSFKYRFIRTTFVLRNGKFKNTNSDTLTVEGLRTTINISNGDSVLQQLEGTIYGMNADDMNSLTAYTLLNADSQQGYDFGLVKVEVGDDDKTDVIFEGRMTNGMADYNQAPDVPFNFSAYPDALAWKSAEPISFKGSVKVDKLLSQIAGRMGLQYQQTGITASLSNPYLAGTDKQKLDKLAARANFDYFIEGKGLYCVAKGKAMERKGQDIIVLTPDSGLIGYPSFDVTGVNFQCLYSPNLHFKGEVHLQIQHDLALKTEATIVAEDPSGNNLVKLFIQQMNISLEAETPNGRWFASINANRLAIPAGAT